MKSMKMSHVSYQITGFLVFRFYSETPFCQDSAGFEQDIAGFMAAWPSLPRWRAF